MSVGEDELPDAKIMPIKAFGEEIGHACIHCGSKPDAVIAYADSVKPTDITVCGRCGEVMQFDENLKLTVPEEGWQEKMGPERLQKVAAYQAFIRVAEMIRRERGVTVNNEEFDA